MSDVNITYTLPNCEEITVNTALVDEDVIRVRMGLEPHDEGFDRKEDENVKRIRFIFTTA